MANASPSECQSCGRPLPAQQGKGRQRRYCSATCRSAARRRRAANVKHQLTTATHRGDTGGGGSTPLAEVSRARDTARAAEEALRGAVERARDAGHTWQEVGVVLGTTRQAACQRFGRPADAPVPARFLERAVALLADVVARRWPADRADLDEPMLAGATTEKLTSGWAQVPAGIGRYERMGEPYAVRAGEHVVVNVPLHCGAGEVLGQVSFNADGSVGGLCLLPA
jgi:hypothetical protein